MGMAIRVLIPLLLLALGAPLAAQDDHADHDRPALPDGSHSERPASGAPEERAESAPAPLPPAAPSATETDSPPAILAKRGNGGFPIATSAPEAQAYFDNGIALAMAFDHEESRAAMAEAARLDPECAMCLWGVAYTRGPNINDPARTEEQRGEYSDLLRRARKLAAGGPPLELALIDALALRFRAGGKPERRDRAYSAAMRKLAADYPDHDTAQVLAAEAAFFEPAGTLEEFRPAMAYAMSVLEPVLARNPGHTPAIHFYIHATEIYGEPGKAERHADRLDAMRLEASHLAHMPSHTWYWVGRYADAADANRRAVLVDHANARHGGSGDVWDLPYHAHNIIFGLGGALMADDSRTALMLARPLVAYVEALEEGQPYRQLLASAGYFALGRFEDPQAVLALPEPKAPYLKAAWRYARGEAHAFLGDTAGLAAEIEAIPPRVGEPGGGGEEGDAGLGPPQQMLAIARAVLRGRLATIEGRHNDAAAAFAEGALIEETDDFQRFTDPPAFWYPVRRDLARALWAAGDREGALREARATLELRPKDPGATALIAQIERTSV